MQTIPSFSFHLPVHSTSSWQEIFFIYICVIPHEFVLTSLRKTYGFLPRFLTIIPHVLLLSQPQSKGWFIIRQMTLGLMLVYSFINFVIPFPATYIRHYWDNCWNFSGECDPVNWLSQTRRNLAIEYLNSNFVTTPKLTPLHYIHFVQKRFLFLAFGSFPSLFDANILQHILSDLKFSIRSAPVDISN